MPGADFLDRISDFTFDGTLTVYRLAERVYDTAQQALANRNLQELAGRADLATFFKLCVVA